MDCCDANGRCTGGTGCAARPMSTHTSSCSDRLRFAPGALEGYRAPLFGSPAQRRELKRWLLPSLCFTASVGLVALVLGLIAGRYL